MCVLEDEAVKESAMKAIRKYGVGKKFKIVELAYLGILACQYR
jgi:hypothetical protein